MASFAFISNRLYTVLKICSPFRIFEKIAIAPKHRVCPENFHYIEYTFHHSGCLSNLRLPWKTECALNSLYWIYIFYHSGFLSNLRLHWKTIALKFFTVLKYFLSFRIFERLALTLKNRMCPEFTVLNIYFLSFRIFEQLALALKNRVALKFFTLLKYFLSFRIFEQLALALKTEFVMKVFKPGVRGGLPTPRLVHLWT